MRLRYLLCLSVALASSTLASAQIGIYGTATGGHLGGINAPYPYAGSYSFWTAGGTFGIYDDFARLGPVHLGADLRSSILNTHGRKLGSALGGIRFVIKPPVLPLRPYLQASVGAGSTNFGANSNTTTGFQYQVFGGLDFTFFPHLDWRVAEVGGGGLRINGNNYPVTTISTGIVFRIH